jgi:hypothetical protein
VPREPRYFTDAEGIWCEGAAKPFGIRWDEIYRVTGYKLDCITEVDTCLEIDFEYGEFMELNGRFPGFNDVVDGITNRLPGIDPDWFQKVSGLGIDDPPIVVWHRSDT